MERPQPPNPFQISDRENYPPVHGIFGRGVPPVPDGSDSGDPIPSPSASSLVHERSAARRARVQPSPSAADASTDFRDAGEALADLSNNLEGSVIFARADAGHHAFPTPVNIRSPPLETPRTRQLARERDEQEQQSAERFFCNRQPGPGSTPRPRGQPLYEPGQTPQHHPASAESQRSAPHSGHRGPSATPPSWRPSSTIPEHTQASGYVSSNGDFGRGVTGGLEDAEMQTEISIAPLLLCQIVPFTPPDEEEATTHEEIGTHIPNRHRPATTPRPEQPPFQLDMSPLVSTETPIDATADPGVSPIGAEDQSALDRDITTGEDGGALAFSNVESPPANFFARDSEISAPRVSGSSSGHASGGDETQRDAHPFNRSLPPPHPEVYASHDDGRPVSPIAQSQSPGHIQMHSPGELGSSSRHFGDAVAFEPSPIHPAGDGIDAVSSIHSASSPNPAARRSLQQDFSQAEVSVRDDGHQSNRNSQDGLADAIANTLSFSEGESGSVNSRAPAIHRGSGGDENPLASQAPMHSVHAFSDESSGGHEFDDIHTAIGSRERTSNMRSLGRDGDMPQRSPSRDFATQTDDPGVQTNGASPSSATHQVSPSPMHQSQHHHDQQHLHHHHHHQQQQQQQQPQHSAGAHRVGPPIATRHGGEQLWAVYSEHHDETAQSTMEHAFLQGTTQQPNAHEPSSNGAVAHQHMQQVSPPAIGGPAGASPLFGTTTATAYGQYGRSTNAVGADYVPPYQRHALQHGDPRAAAPSPTRTGTSPTSTAGSTTPTAPNPPWPYSPSTGHVAYGAGTAYALSAAMSSARVRPQTVLGTRTLSPGSATPFVSPFRIPPTLSSWRSSLGYPMTSALRLPSASSLSFHRHYSGSPVYTSSPVFRSGFLS